MVILPSDPELAFGKKSIRRASFTLVQRYIYLALVSSIYLLIYLQAIPSPGKAVPEKTILTNKQNYQSSFDEPSKTLKGISSRLLSVPQGALPVLETSGRWKKSLCPHRPVCSVLYRVPRTTEFVPCASHLSMLPSRGVRRGRPGLFFLP
jgi:hypothetical protein